MALYFIEYTEDFSTDGDLQEPWVTPEGLPACQATGGYLNALKPSTGDSRYSYYALVSGVDVALNAELVALPDEGEFIGYRILIDPETPNGANYALLLGATTMALWYVDHLSGGYQGPLVGGGEEQALDASIVPGARIWIMSEAGVINCRTGDTDAELSAPFMSAPMASGSHTTGYAGFLQYMPSGGGNSALDNCEVCTVRGPLGLTSVNADNVIIHGGQILIACSSGDTVTGVTLDDGVDSYALTIDSKTNTLIVCDPLDVHLTKFAYSQSDVSLILDDGSTTDSIIITLAPIVANIYLEATSIDATDGLLHVFSGIPAIIGDGYEGPKAVGTSPVQYETDGPHRNIDPAVPNDTLTTGWYYDSTAKTWTVIDEETDQDGTVGLSWRGTPNPTPCVVGVPYSYNIGGLVDGERPITLTLVGGTLPNGLDIVGETIAGTPTASGEFPDIIIQASNAT